MRRSPPRAFGKRNAVAAATRSAVPVPVAPAVPGIPLAPLDDSAAQQDHRATVPRSFQAAILAGLAVGCCLAGLDVARAGAINPALQPLFALTGLGDGHRALPYMIALSLLSGGRVAATTLLMAHRLLALAGLTSFTAYGLGGAAIAGATAGLAMALGHAPQHHLIVDLAGGGAAGFFYRLFAGARA